MLHGTKFLKQWQEKEKNPADNTQVQWDRDLRQEKCLGKSGVDCCGWRPAVCREVSGDEAGNIEGPENDNMVPRHYRISEEKKYMRS